MNTKEYAPWQTQGTYLLIISLEQATRLQVGKLGVFNFEPGKYGYVGSALGPGGLAARLNRHLRQEKKAHWHIDYLTAIATITSIWTISAPQRLECAWANALCMMPNTFVPALGFGSSDCRCPSHLVYLAQATRTMIKQTLGPSTCGLDQNLDVFDLA